jgi:hemolysin III
MCRTKLADRIIPNYTRGEELFNMVSHIVGGGLGVVAFLTCIIVAAYNQNIWGIVSGAVYGFTVILLFTMSSIYHGLPNSTTKKVFQILDHCTIFILIAGTYTPILLGQFRKAYPVRAWTNFAIVWGLAVLGIALNAIDLKRFKVFSIVCYLGMGWLVVFSFQKVKEVLGRNFVGFLLLGGIFYTIGAALYVLGKRSGKKYIHSIFHIFVDIAALMHFLGIAIYIMPVA